MKITYTPVLAQSYLDKQPVYLKLTYEAIGAAPHALANQAIYIVPAGKRAKLQYVSILLSRDSAAGTVGDVRAFFTHVVSATVIYLARIRYRDNTAGRADQLTVPLDVDMETDDRILIWTGDSSTGGTVSYNLGAYFIEYTK